MRSYYSASAGEPQPATPLRPGRFGLTDTRVLTSCSAQQLEQEAREIQVSIWPRMFAHGARLIISIKP